MNIRDPLAIPDVQGSEDRRKLAIDQVGIKAIRHPVRVAERSGEVQHTIATFNMYVGLPHQFKGTHNQRSHVTITARTNGFVWIEELVDYAEEHASSELYGLLKRPDEKFVTERAYDNPKFVEDMVRDIAAELNRDKRIEWYRVESENFESIHNHSAYALIEKDKSKT